MASFDLAVVGGGPAGLQAALKGALMYKRVVLFDRAQRFSRVFYAPRVANVPASPEPMKGSEIVKRGYLALERVNDDLGDLVTIHERTEVTAVERDDEGFSMTCTGAVEGPVRADVLILATGVVDRQPWISPDEQDISPILPYANRGLAEYCMLCDGHTVIGKDVVVLGADETAVGVAESLRDGFDANVTVAVCVACATGQEDHADHEHAAAFEKAREAGIEALDLTLERIEGLEDDEVVLVDQQGARHRFDRAFLSFGWYQVNNELAKQLGAETSRSGYLFTDQDCQLLDRRDGEPLGGVYAIGDLRYETWNQVPSAWADAETAVIHAWAQSI